MENYWTKNSRRAINQSPVRTAESSREISDTLTNEKSVRINGKVEHGRRVKESAYNRAENNARRN